jgi:septal ring factor EnvC (AmiA/AmiB activator)
MKEVTRAYESGDVARLLEIEREWLVAVPTRDHEDELARRIAQLLQANKELRRQLRALTAEVKELKQSVPGMEPTRRRSANAAFNPTAQVQHAIEEMERELAQLQVLRDFAQSFLDGDIDLAEFLLGPPMSTEEGDPFEQLLEEMLEEMMESPRRRPSQRGGKRRR